MSTLPILKIDDDSLLTIFEIITLSRISRHNSDRNRPQAVIRAASQVCRQWRQLLIQSPWIWGRVLDLGVVNHGPRRTEWMNEVVRRAGESAPLWVSGMVNISKNVGPWPKFDSEAFLLRVLESLERIERVSLVIHGSRIPSRITRPFLSRAPILRIFHLKFPDISDPVLLSTFQPESSKRLFSDYAPYLEDIHTHKVAIRVDSRCLSKIRRLYLSGLATDHISLQNLLVLLQHTPSLQSLDIGARYSSNVRTSLLTPNPDVAPPKLSDIGISSGFRIASKVLGYVVPGNLTGFRISLLDADKYLIDQDVLPSFAQNLPSFISSYFSLNKSTKVSLIVSPRSFDFTDTTPPSSLSRPDDHPTFFLNLYHNLLSDVDQDSVITCLIGAFLEASTLSPSPCHYQFVNEIAITLTALRSKTFSILYPMLALFNNVQSMTTDDDSCKTLLGLHHHVEGAADYPLNILFPKLHTVSLARTLRPGPPPAYTNVVKFFSHRKKIGFPVAKFDVRTTALDGIRLLHDLSGLEQVGGLEVTWTQPRPGLEGVESVEVCSYMCGSGDPKRLKVRI